MKFDDYINEGIHVGTGFQMARATIVGPYPTRDFIDQLLTWGPEEIVLAADDGWPQHHLEDIAAACRDNDTDLVLRRVAPAEGGGLVHAKLYCFEWTNAANTYRRHILLAGSANASVQGFGGHAESFISIDLADIDAKDKKSALQYFSNLGSGLDVSQTWFYVNEKSWLSMPSLRIVHTALPNGFDAWLRRGRLCHKYQPDPMFGRLVLRLKEPMAQGELSESLGKSGFGVVGETQTFSRPYLPFGTGEAGSERLLWRQRFFTETDYGYWTSAECFGVLQGEFVASDAGGRQRTLEAIRSASLAQRSVWIDGFLDSIRAVFTALPDTEQRASYFCVLPNGDLDELHYRQHAEAKLARDREKSMDEYFAKRFTSGFAFPQVPPLGDEFEEFALTLCANLLAKAQGQHVRNWLARTLRNLNVVEPGMTPAELLASLRECWDELKPDLSHFFRE